MPKSKLAISHTDKIFWPKEKYTKGDVVDYYRKIGKYILPYLKNRPENLNRHPNGISKPGFYQKDVDHLPPQWVKVAKIYSTSNRKNLHYLVCNDLDTLLYLANLGCIEINPWFSRTNNLNKPDYLVLDLDPEKISFDQVVKVAQTIHQILDRIKVKNFCKTSGSRGLHIYVPLNGRYTFEQAKRFAHIIAMRTNQRLPQITSLQRHPAKRQGKVYLDYLQNAKGQTLAAPYSLRPRPGATVATPLLWREVRVGLDPKKFNIKTIFPRLKQKGDLFRPVLGKGINLKYALNRLAALR